MADGLAYRLDLVDSAVEAGWHVESTRSTDYFERASVTVLVQYSQDDAISSIQRSRPRRDDEIYGSDSSGNEERLKIWLGIRTPAQAARELKVPDHLKPKSGDWTRDEFIAAVEDPGDRAFLLTLLTLADSNSNATSVRLPFRLYFGSKPSGHMFVYPFGRRFPPFKFKVKEGTLRISGCWNDFPILKGHQSFAEIAAMLDLDENGTASSVPVAGLDANEVWEVGERVSKAINS
jgi:hypothetical protein